MFDEIDIEKLEAEELKRNEVRKNFEQYGEDEIAMAQMREQASRSVLEENVRALEAVEEKLNLVSDDKIVINSDIEKFDEKQTSEEDEKPSEEQAIEDEPGSTKADLEYEAKPEVKIDNSLVNERDNLIELMKQKDELLLKMYNDLVSSKQVVKEEVKKEIVEEPEVKAEDFEKMAKDLVEKLTYNDESAPKMLAQMLAEVSKRSQPKAVKQDFDDSRIEEVVRKIEEKRLIQNFENAKQTFANSEDGKKILADDDLLDLFQVKYNRLQSTGKHLNPEDLFRQATELTYKTVGITKTNSSTTKPVPKVADSLKDDVSKAEESKRQALKPSSSSNAGKTVDSKKYSEIDDWKKLQEAMGYKIY